MTNPTPTCATCRFSKPTADYKHLVRCYRNPPLSGGDAVYWPQVAKESWCGEHKPAAPATPEKPDAGARAMDLLREVNNLIDKHVCEWVKVNPSWPERVRNLLRESGEGAK
jgi:hypothetical protein